MSAGTSTSSRSSRSERSSFAGVIIFMYLHTAARLTGSNSTSGLALRSWWSIPVSVATSTFVAVVCLAAVTIPDVDRILVRSGGTTPAPARYSALVAQPHSGWMNSSASGSASTRSRRSAPLMPAWTWHSPIQMCMFSPAGQPLHVGAEELVGAEQDLAVLGDRGDDVDGVRRRAADVGLGLHRGGGVDVADDDGAGVLGLPGPQLVGGDRLGQAAAGALVGDQHGLVVAEDLRRLGHEVDAAEHDDGRARPRPPPGTAPSESPTWSAMSWISGHLVVVGEDHGVALAGQLEAPRSRQSGRSPRVSRSRSRQATGRARTAAPRGVFMPVTDPRHAPRPHRRQLHPGDPAAARPRHDRPRRGRGRSAARSPSRHRRPP